VLSTCQGWRRHEGAGGADLARGFSNANFAQYNVLAGLRGRLPGVVAPDMPGYGNPLKDNANQPMLSFFPFLYY
jgi:hypothetical protein